ncbi:hypothetical protein LINPERHAP1_LOCUS37038 [Linum perenne]
MYCVKKCKSLLLSSSFMIFVENFWVFCVLTNYTCSNLLFVFLPCCKCVRKAETSFVFLDCSL